jgi:hypothetical protein
MSIQDALNQAAATLHEISGRDNVSYVREATTIPLTKPILGASSQEVNDDNGIVVRSKAHDWLIDPTDLVISDTPFEPEPGHRIVVNLGAGSETWEVQNRGADGCWRWSGPARNRMRVFVRRIPAS